MASDSYPRPGSNSGIVTELGYERLASMQAPDGLNGDPSQPALVYADGVTGPRIVRVRANRRALVRGFIYESGPDDINVQLPTNTSGTSRTDLIVLRLDRATWRVQETFIQGTPGQGAPSPVQQVNSGFWDLPVAQVTVAHNAATLAPTTVVPVAWYVGADGQILCTPTTRPPHERGRRIFEHTTGRGWLSTGSAWLTDADDSGPLTLPLASGWGSSVNILHRANGQVFLALSVMRSGGNIGDGVTSTVGTLPAGFRPRAAFEGLAHAQSTGSGRFVVNSNGTVQLTLYGGLATSRYANLHPLTFPAA